MSSARISDPLRERITTVIDKLVEGKKAFTVVDICNRVQLDKKGFASYSMVRTLAIPMLTQLLLNNYRYACSTIPIVSGKKKGETVLYHTNRYDVSKYKNREQIILDASSGTALSSHHPTVTGRSVHQQQTRKDKYIEVPRPIWQAAGFKPGYDYVADIHPSSLTIYHRGSKTKYKTTITRILSTEDAFEDSVPAAGRFRLSPKLLEKAGLTNVDEFDFSQFTDKIVVSKLVRVS